MSFIFNFVAIAEVAYSFITRYIVVSACFGISNVKYLMWCTELRTARQNKEEKRAMLAKVVTNRCSWLTTVKES